MHCPPWHISYLQESGPAYDGTGTYRTVLPRTSNDPCSEPHVFVTSRWSMCFTKSLAVTSTETGEPARVKATLFSAYTLFTGLFEGFLA